MAKNNVVVSWVDDPENRMRLFCDVADAAPLGGAFNLKRLVGEVVCLTHYTAKTQLEVIRGLIAAMRESAWKGDRLVRVPGGAYRWEFYPTE